MLWICLPAFADDPDPTAATDELPEWEPPAPAERYATPEDDPRRMVIKDEMEMQFLSYGGGYSTTRFKPRWNVVDGEGEVDVPTLVVRLHDAEVQDRRKKEVVGTAVSGGIGGLLLLCAGGLVVSGATQRSDAVEAGAAVLAAGGGVTLVLGPGGAMYRSGRPDKYWEREDMQERLDAWNEELGAPVEPEEPLEPVEE
jgi:hypothetical protein